MITRPLLVLLAASPTVLGQVDHLPIQYRSTQVDSGYKDHATGTKRTVFDRDVHVPGAAWIRLYFEQTNLPVGSELRLSSRQDGAVQRHDARTLIDYGQTSAYFNGDRVRVQLLAAEGSKANRVRVHRVEFVTGQRAGTESICGPTDDRRLSNDPRVGRAVSGAGACSWWLIDEFTILTAGHCTSRPGSTVIIGFNIPLSTSNGTYVQPPPDDQYPVDVSTLRFGTGFGRDWAVVAANRNSNHGQYPGQRQGSWFDLGPVPSSPAGVTIRITGNGRVSAPVSPTWNAVQKTHTGDCVRTSSYIQYKTDTTGGNSGSPIIHEQTGKAIGIHTHGGCSSSGGQNSGTRIDLSALRAAITAVRGSKVAGSLSVYGTGCGMAPAPKLAMAGVPDIGGQVDVTVTNLPTGQAGTFLIGASDQSWQGAQLPLELSPFGFPGCHLYTSISLQVTAATGTGTVAQAFVIPAATSLIGLDAFLQFAAGTPTGGAVFSNGGKVHIGGR